MKLRLENDWYWPITPMLMLALAFSVWLAFVGGPSALPLVVNWVLILLWSILERRRNSRQHGAKK